MGVPPGTQRTMMTRENSLERLLPSAVVAENNERSSFEIVYSANSQMPRHLISDAHEWINEIPAVPIYYLAKPQPRERAWNPLRGKKTLLRKIFCVI